MARAKAGHGHNSGDLTDEQKSALLHHHLIGIRQAQKQAEVVKATYDARRDEVNKAFAACKGDLGFKRKDLEELLAAMNQTEVAFRNNENARRERFRLAGLPIGAQLDMFATDTVGDRDAARSDGYRAGVRADDMAAPDYIDPLFRGDWEDGWRDGQAENARKFALAMGVIEARSAPAEVETVGDEEPEPEDVEEALDEAARKLKRSGFTNRSTETVGDEAPAAA